MKKLTLTLLGLVAISTSAVAQQEVKFGPKAGVNISNLSGVDNSEMKIGFHVGAVAEIKFNEKFSVQPEVIYSSQGNKGEFLMANVKLADYTQTIDYINIPIMAKYYIVEGFSVELGPQVGFIVKAETKYENKVVGATVTDGDNKDFYKSIDFGLGVGLAYDLPMGFFVGGRYNLGLADIRENSDNGDAIKNSVIQVGVGYKF